MLASGRAGRASTRRSIHTPIRRRRASRNIGVQPKDASFSEALGEFVLPYERVRAAKDPGGGAAGLSAIDV